MTTSSDAKPTNEADAVGALGEALSPFGLLVRGGFHPGGGEAGLDGIGTVLLVGNAGGAMWEAFAPHAGEGANPLDEWTRRVLDPIAECFHARTAFPFGPEAPPFQRWALRAETLYASPLGILIHPRFGLWHAYRGALLFTGRLALPDRSADPNPCENCDGKPCLSACPVGAFEVGRYDVASCAAHVAAPSSDCLDCGCHARRACPVGRDYRYGEEQVRFHMQAFGRALRT